MCIYVASYQRLAMMKKTKRKKKIVLKLIKHIYAFALIFYVWKFVREEKISIQCSAVILICTFEMRTIEEKL